MRRHGLPARARELVLLALTLAAFPGPAGGSPPPAAQERPSDETLRRIEERGRQIASSVAAVAKARDLLARQGEGVTPPDRIVAIEDRGVWNILYLRDVSGEAAPGMPRQGTLVVAETEYSPISEDVGPLRAMLPPRPAAATAVSYARALAVAEQAAAERKEASHSEEAVIREKNGAFTVYLLARPEKASIVTFGGDFVVNVAANGRQLVSIEPLHSSSTDIPLDGRSGGQPTLHVHPSEDLPTPTDVAQVCGHGSIAPHLVMTPHFIFRIGDRGALTYLGPSQAAGPGSPGPGAASAGGSPPPAAAPAMTPPGGGP